eukprot:CAMPEP_0206615728 /NCGR_PEP_ID=MMETSP0325_2-20121206/58459_1 /ASSEMBLY_ACC=CAM_ASM_000347 /TAXON_ID=2866 /ORGANISM="Crypthecodinium cohnii, Strain Seligo" /LENGTH=45 /DNA_ID= /DNA_START= /DNA_END= /DNA_ORIENTATION=
MAVICPRKCQQFLLGTPGDKHWLVRLEQLLQVVQLEVESFPVALQ